MRRLIDPCLRLLPLCLCASLACNQSGSGSAGGHGAAARKDPGASAKVQAAPAPGAWAAAGNAADGRVYQTATLLGSGKVLVAGGGNTGGNVFSTAELFDPGSGKHSSTGPLATGRQGAVAVMLRSGKVLVSGGQGAAGAISSCEVYDPAAGTFSATGSLATARQNHTAVMLASGKVLAIGGAGPAGAASSAELYDPAAGSWSAAGALVAPGYQQTATLLADGRVLVTGGYDPSRGFVTAAQTYDPATNTWTAAGNLLVARSAHTATLLTSGVVLVAGGASPSATATAEFYDPSQPGLGWTSAGTMTTPRSGHTATLLPNGRVLVSGGTTGADSLTTSDLWDVNLGWSPAAPLITGRYFHTATLLASGKVLVEGGYSGVDTRATSAEIYDSYNPKYLQANPPAVDRLYASATLLPNGKALVCGGSDPFLGPIATCELYDPANASFKATGRMTTGRQFQTATLLLSGQVLIAGGVGADGLTIGASELYDPAQGTFSTTGSQTAPRWGHTATLLADGRVLLAGGIDDVGTLATSDLYDPLTGQWTAAGNLKDARYQHTATLLPGGQVLAVGGRVGTTLVGTAEIFDPTARTWGATAGAPLLARAQHLAARLSSGKVLFASGGVATSNFDATAELFDPATGLFTVTGSMSRSRSIATGTTLASGRVVVIGGQDVSGRLLNDEVYDPATGAFSENFVRYADASYGHTSTLLSTGRVLVQGGVAHPDAFPIWAEEFAEGADADFAWLPALTAPPSRATLGRLLSLTGTGFNGVSGASGGSSADSATNYPVLSIQAVDSGASVYAYPAAFTASTVAAVVPADFPAGYALVRVVVNGLASPAAVVDVLPLLKLDPASANVPSGATQLFVGTGGTRSNYQYTLLDNQSGASLGATSGSYLAGPTAGVTDLLQVLDSSGATATSTVSVLPNLTISPATASVPPRGQQKFAATGVPAGATFTWSVATGGSTGATIDSTGLYTAGGTGGTSDIITVVSFESTATATIAVGAPLAVVPANAAVVPGATKQFTTTGGSSKGITWVVGTSASGGSITAGGLYTAGRAGSTSDTVRATDDLGNVATSAVSVSAGVSITPSAVSVAPLGTKQFAAAGGSGVTFVWSLTASPSGGSIDAQGLYTAGSTGGTTDTVKVVDSLGNIGTATVSVGGGLVVSPASANAAPRGTVQLTPSGGSGAGYTFAFVANGSGATLTAGGLYTAGATGSKTDLVKVSDSLGASVNVTITVGAVLSVSPAAVTLAPGASKQFTTAGGSGAIATWAFTANTSGGTLSQTGLYLAGSKGSGSDSLEVTDSLGLSATATVTLTASLALSPATANAFPQQTLQLSVSGGSGGGFVWSMATGTSGGTVSQTGSYKAGATGSTVDVVRVTDGNSNTATVTITVGAGVGVTPATASVTPKGTKSLTAAGGSGTGYSWSIGTNGSGCAVNASGVYTAGPTGGTTDVIKVTDSLGNFANATFTVTGGLTVAPATLSLAPKGTRQLTVSGGSGTGYLWSLTVNGSGGAITDTGLYTAGSTGSSTDTITVVDSLGLSATLNVVVTAAISATPSSFTVSPRESKSITVTGGSGTGYVWVVAVNGSGSTIDQAGKYTAGPNGGVVELVKVTDSLGNTASITVTVGPGVAVTPGAARVPPRGTKQLAASGGNGAYTWSVDTVAGAGSGGTITAAGLFTAGPVGSTVDTIKVIDTLGNFARAQITVTENVSILPGSQQLPPRSSQIFRASGGSLAGYTWALTSNGSGATLTTVTDTATYKAGAAGDKTDTIQVTDSLGNGASVTVQVTAALTVSPTAASLAPRATQKIVASGGSGIYAYAIAQGSTGGGLASSTGQYTAGPTEGGVDTVLVSDTLGNSATSVFTITTKLTIAPAALTIAPLGTQTFAGAGGSGAGFTYTLVDTSASGGSVNPTTGAYKTGARGDTKDAVRVTDSLGNVAVAQITVTATLTVSPTAGSLPPRGQQQLTAAGGSKVYTWKMVPGSGSGGTVSATGLYTAGTNGVTTDTVQVTDSLGSTATAAFIVTVGLSISPTSRDAVTSTQYSFTAVGGSSVYTWAMTKSGSGSPTVTDGAYTAGKTGRTIDEVTVTDSVGNSAVATINVAPTPVRASGCGCGAADGGTAFEFVAFGLGLFWQRRRARASKR